MLSGIGPAGHLREMGIEVGTDLPGVGANLQDHPQSRVGYIATRPTRVAALVRRPLVVLRSDPSVAEPDLQFVFGRSARRPAGHRPAPGPRDRRGTCPGGLTGRGDLPRPVAPE
jgi:choline dehydrogenase